VIEAGIGGKYDTTNVVSDKKLTILTSVGLDHCDLLGNTVEEICQDKLGILRRGTP
jgi:folylpolyglutamate synthase/dihydropteroate synthase